MIDTKKKIFELKVRRRAFQDALYLFYAWDVDTKNEDIQYVMNSIKKEIEELDEDIEGWEDVLRDEMEL